MNPDRLKLESEKLVLDIGSGHLPREDATHLCDLYPTSDKERGGHLKINQKPFVRCTVEFLPFQENCFSSDYACHVLEHANDPELALYEITRVASCGYIEAPSELAEKIFGWDIHKWVLSYKKDTILFRKRQTHSHLFSHESLRAKFSCQGNRSFT